MVGDGESIDPPVSRVFLEMVIATVMRNTVPSNSVRKLLAGGDRDR